MQRHQRNDEQHHTGHGRKNMDLMSNWCWGSHQCISNQFLNRTKLSEVHRLEPSDIPQVRWADGKVANLHEKVEIPIQVPQKQGRKTRQRTFALKFYVVPGLTHKILLGTDFLRSHQAATDLRKRTLALRPLRVNAIQRCIILAQCETIQMAAIQFRFKIPPQKLSRGHKRKQTGS